MTKIRKITIFFITIFLLTGIKCFATSGTVNAPNGLVLRETASKSANPITTVNDKENVEIEETLEEWYKVKYNGYEGYLYKEYVNANEEEKSEEPIQEEQVEISTETIIEDVKKPLDMESSFPKQASIENTLKIYIMPSITSTVLNTIELGNTVTVTKILNSWAYITTDKNENGWVRKNLINITEEISETEQSEENQSEAISETEKNVEEEYEAKKGYINVSTSANVRETASTSASIITTLTTNTEVTIVGEEGDWYKITYNSYTGYVSKTLISNKPVATTSRGNVERATENIEIKSPIVTDSALTGGAQVAELAQQCIGCSYAYGGTSTNGFDCSGFTQYIYNSCGYSINRTASAQSSNGYEVSKDELIPGDLLLFDNTSDGSIGHVGIYIGGGTFVHAANSRRGVTTDTINSGYYNTYYYSARRIAN